MKIALLLSVILVPLLAETPLLPDAGSLSSSNASYDGNALQLTGRVQLDHGLGKMTSEEAILQRQEAGKDFPFSFIQLRKDVEVALKSNARLFCESADLDFTALKGTLLPAENSKVIYTDQLKKRRGKEEIALQLSSQCIELNFLKQEHDGKKSDYDIETVLATQNVVISYGKEIQLQSDRAIYRRELPKDNKTASKEFQGILTAYPKDEHSLCRLTHGADVIDASMIDLNLIHSKITLLRPKGTIARQSPLEFASDHLFWDQIQNTLTLKGNVHIQENMIGTLDAQEELTIVQATVGERTQIQSVRTTGPATLQYKTEDGTRHKLLSQGVLFIDKTQLRATIESPSIKGRVLPEQQLYYEENDLAVHADRAQIEYALSGESIQPTSITLTGNIRLFSHDPKMPPRCGIADRLNYSLTTQTLILSANPGNKVLFWDETQGMHLAAPEVHITHDPETNQQNIKGIGKVQFAFTPEEQSKFQQIFPHLP